MKKFLLLLCLLIGAGRSFAQDGKIIERYLEQIASLEAYIKVLEKGYDIVKKGTEIIGNIKKGDLSLHSDYFSSLKSVSPAVKKYVRVGDIIALQVNILAVYNACHKETAGSGWFTGGETDFIFSFLSNMLNASMADLDVLLTVTASGTVGMSDDERLRRIDRLYVDMQRIYATAQSFRQTTQAMSLYRQREQGDIQNGKNLYGIP